MGYELFENYRPNDETKKIIGQAANIIDQYQQAGMQMTLRQLYYQFVAADLIENSDRSYERLGRIISRARLGGYLDWSAIEDRNRRPVIWKHYDTVQDVINQAISSFRLPRLNGQDTYVELWVEKDALSGVLRPVAAEHHVTMMANKGYSSSSAMKEAGDRIRWACGRYGSERALILYLGDLDPSGEDMVRDIDKRITDFVNSGLLVDWDNPLKVAVEDYDEMQERKPWIDVEVRKLALTIEQVRKYKPPPNPAKLKDSRAKAFIRKYGKNSWEVDALPPTTLRDLIEKELKAELDMGQMNKIIDSEKAEVDRLRGALASMDDKLPSAEALHRALEGMINEFNAYAGFTDDEMWDIQSALDSFKEE